MTNKMQTKKTKTILVENVDPILWRKFVGLAAYDGLKVGELLNDVIAVHIEKQKLRGGKRGVGLNG